MGIGVHLNIWLIKLVLTKSVSFISSIEKSTLVLIIMFVFLRHMENWYRNNQWKWQYDSYVICVYYIQRIGYITYTRLSLKSLLVYIYFEIAKLYNKTEIWNGRNCTLLLQNSNYQIVLWIIKVKWTFACIKPTVE